MHTTAYYATLLKGLDSRFSMITPMKMAVFWDVAPCSLVDTD
jgi:hypothetical protein